MQTDQNSFSAVSQNEDAESVFLNYVSVNVSEI